MSKTRQIPLHLLVDVDEGRRRAHSGQDGEAEAVRLVRAVIGILPQDHHLDVIQLGQFEGIEPRSPGMITLPASRSALTVARVSMKYACSFLRTNHLSGQHTRLSSRCESSFHPWLACALPIPLPPSVQLGTAISSVNRARAQVGSLAPKTQPHGGQGSALPAWEVAAAFTGNDRCCVITGITGHPRTNLMGEPGFRDAEINPKGVVI